MTSASWRISLQCMSTLTLEGVHCSITLMLARSKFVQLTADFVQRFAQLGDRMRIYTEAAAFDTALSLVAP
jgi:hypothetical protein